MIRNIEKIHFTKGLQEASRNMSPLKYRSFKKRLCCLFGTKTDASLSRHANALYRTPLTIELMIGAEFEKEGIQNWKGKARKKVTKTAKK